MLRRRPHSQEYKGSTNWTLCAKGKRRSKVSWVGKGVHLAEVGGKR